MQSRNLTVLWRLHCDLVHAQAKTFEGRSMKTSKQSITTATLSPNVDKKHSGMIFIRVSLSGHSINGCNSASKIVSHLDSTLQMVEVQTSNRYAKS